MSKNVWVSVFAKSSMTVINRRQSRKKRNQGLRRKSQIHRTKSNQLVWEEKEWNRYQWCYIYFQWRSREFIKNWNITWNINWIWGVPLLFRRKFETAKTRTNQGYESNKRGQSVANHLALLTTYFLFFLRRLGTFMFLILHEYWLLLPFKWRGR